MAEIKSTMDMVLARAEAMCAEASDMPDDTLLHEGMKFAASFMGDESIEIADKFTSLTADERPLFAKGVLQTFSRSITLPRGENSSWQRALHGVNDLAAVALPSFPPNLVEILNEVRSLLGRYADHQAQLRSQLEEQFAMQAAQLAQTMEQQTGAKMNIRPDQHPKFHEEWSRVVDQLNSQYTNAIDQYKAAIEGFFNFSS